MLGTGFLIADGYAFGMRTGTSAHPCLGCGRGRPRTAASGCGRGRPRTPAWDADGDVRAPPPRDADGDVRAPLLWDDYLGIPATFINGSEDIRPSWPTRQLAALMPNGRYVQIDGAAHTVWLIHAAELRTALRGALAHIEALT